LADQDDFRHLLGQKPRLVQEKIDRPALVRAAYGRDGAEPAVVRTPFRYLEEGVGRAGGQVARGLAREVQGQRLGGHGGPQSDLLGVQPQVHLGQSAYEVLAVARDQAPGHADHRLASALQGRVRGLADNIQDSCDGFLDGGLDEAAGVDQHQIRVQDRFRGDHVRPERAEQPLGVHPVLGTAQADGVCSHGRYCRFRHVISFDNVSPLG
jgi:hypothetical protein